jgi:hypothetical protein
MKNTLKKVIPGLMACFITGTVSAQTQSGEQYKYQVPLTNGISLLNKIQPVVFENNGSAGQRASDGPRFGIVARELQQQFPRIGEPSRVLPGLANATGLDRPLTGLNADQLLPILIGALKEQQVEIEELKQHIEELDVQAIK